MSSSLSLLVLTTVLAFSFPRLPVATASTFSQYSFLDHPLHTFSDFAASRPTPVIMARYHTFRSDKPAVDGMRYIPGIATYNTQTAPFITGLDALLAPTFKPERLSGSAFIEIRLTGAARVFLLLSGKLLRGSALKAISPSSVISGLPGWAAPVAVSNLAYRASLPGLPKSPNKLPLHGVVVERTFAAGEIISIPDLSAVSIDGLVPTRVTVLFARADIPSPSPPVAFPPPILPSQAALSALAPGVTVSQPVANQLCPQWLHDIHVVASHDSSAPQYWKTWHPQIDSVYWCYFGHEHGAYPGRYRPAYGYTAFKTFDPATGTHQNESHNGFKTFAFPFPDQSRVVVATIHAHLSRARRFTARKHTMVFALFAVGGGGATWTKELELFMKLDFGPAMVSRELSKRVPVTADTAVFEELLANGIKAGRRFNVINAALTSGPDAVRSPVYERWFGPLNTCSLSSGKFNEGMQFDFRNAQSGMLDVKGSTTDANMPYFTSGRNGLNKVMSVKNGGMRIGRALCNFDESVAAFAPIGGVFYTDSYFGKIEAGPGAYITKQFMADGFSEVLVPGGMIFPVDIWNGHMEYLSGSANITFVNLEGSVDKFHN